MISLGPILCICPQHGWILYLCQLLCLACAACGGWWFRLTSRTGFVLILWLPHCEAGVGVWWVLTFLPFGIQLWIKRTAGLSIINTLRLLESPRAYIWKWAYSQDPQHPEKYWVSGLVVGTGMKTVNWCFLFPAIISEFCGEKWCWNRMLGPQSVARILLAAWSHLIAIRSSLGAFWFSSKYKN